MEGNAKESWEVTEDIYDDDDSDDEENIGPLFSEGVFGGGGGGGGVSCNGDNGGIATPFLREGVDCTTLPPSFFMVLNSSSSCNLSTAVICVANADVVVAS